LLYPTLLGVLAVCLALAGALSPLGAQDQSSPVPPQPTFRAGVSFVPVDVIVTDDRGAPVADLTQADFEIREDGAPQVISEFRLIKVDSSGSDDGRRIGAIRDLASENTRVFAIFFDEYHVTETNWIRAREPLTRFLRSLGPEDQVGLMRPLMSVRSLDVTPDHEKVIRQLRLLKGRKCELGPCGFVPQNLVEENWMKRPGVIGVIRPQVVLGALEGLAVALGSLRDGRKSALFISEGFSMMRADLNLAVRDVVKASNRQNVAIYSLDPRGLSPTRAMSATDLLRTLSEETDGRATVNRNALDAGLNEMARDSSVYYLLGYNSAAPTDGKFHPIRVRVKRRDVDVRARKGYWALSEEDVARAAAPPAAPVDPAVETALGAIAPGVTAGRSGVSWLGTSRGESGKTRVTVLWQRLTPGPAAAASRMSIRAVDAAGATVFQGRAPDDTASRPQQLSFDAAPGALSVRIDVDNGAGAAPDTEVRKIQVPDLSPPSAISTPRVFRARTARELQALLGDAQAVPIATRVFSKTERLLIRFDVYEATVRAVLMNRQGGRIVDLPVAVAETGSTHQIELALSIVPPGEYLVEILVKGATTESRELVALRVGA